MKSRPAEREIKSADCPRNSYCEGPQIVRALFLRIPQNPLKDLMANETVLAYRPKCEIWGVGGGGASLCMTTLLRASCYLSAGLVKSTDCLCCISTLIYLFHITENSNPILECKILDKQLKVEIEKYKI